jgi:hypothetical protein
MSQAIALDDLSQQIAQHESQLERLRQQYQARQARLEELGRKRDDLQTQLRQVEDDIQTVTRGEAAGPDVGSPSAGKPNLTVALLDVLRETNRAMTAKELGEELTRRKFPTNSTNITNVVQNRLSDLVKKGVLRKAEGRKGVRLGKATPEAPPTKVAARTTEPPKPSPGKGQPSLRSLLTELLQKARKPVPARELAQQVLATGYQTKSRDFTGVVWTSLGQLEGVENVKGEGWRLKKS